MYSNGLVISPDNSSLWKRYTFPRLSSFHQLLPPWGKSYILVKPLRHFTSYYSYAVDHRSRRHERR